MMAQSQDVEGEGGAGTSLGVSLNLGGSGKSMSLRRVGSEKGKEGAFESAASLGSRTGSGFPSRSASKGKTSKGFIQLSRSRSQGTELGPTDTNASLVDHGEDIDELYRCPLKKSATSEEKKMWIIKMGKHLRFTGSIALPVLKWDAGNEEECLVSQSPSCKNHRGHSIRF